MKPLPHLIQQRKKDNNNKETKIKRRIQAFCEAAAFGSAAQKEKVLFKQLQPKNVNTIRNLALMSPYEFDLDSF